MVDPATTTDHLMTSGEVAAALRQDLFTTQHQLRTGVIPGIKLPGGRWRVKRSDVLAILAGQSTPAQRRRELLGDDVVEFLAELAANAGPLTTEQRDVIASAFRGAVTEPTREVGQ